VTRRWFNAAAVEWVMFEAPRDIPPGAAWTLAAVASFTGTDGRAAYPSIETIAMLTRRSESQVRRDVAWLTRRGLLTRGDPRAVADMRADRRTKVWDLACAAREYIAQHRQRGVMVTPRPDPRGVKTAPNGVSKSPERGVMVTPEELFKSSGKGAPLARTAGAGDDAPPAQPQTPPMPPPCRYCGTQLTREEFGALDADWRQIALNGDMGCENPGCPGGADPETPNPARGPAPASLDELLDQFRRRRDRA
jgi:hypothetical protein